MQLVREPFTVQGGNRDHTVYRSLEKGRPMFFAQHRRSCYEAALFEGRTKVSLGAPVALQSPTRRGMLFCWGRDGRD